MFSTIRLTSLVFLNNSRSRTRVSAVTLKAPLLSSSSQRLKSYVSKITPDPYFYFGSIPNFFKSLSTDSFLSIRDADSARKSRTPLLSLNSPYYPLGFREVEELKHLSSIYLTSTLDSLLAKERVRFSISSFWRVTYFSI